MVPQGTGPNTSCCLPSLCLTKSTVVVGLQVEPTAASILQLLFITPAPPPPPPPSHHRQKKQSPEEMRDWASGRSGTGALALEPSREAKERQRKTLSVWGLMVLQGTSPRWLTEFSALAIGLASLRNLRVWQAFTCNCVGLVTPPACYRVQITRHTLQSHLRKQHSAAPLTWCGDNLEEFDVVSLSLRVSCTLLIVSQVLCLLSCKIRCQKEEDVL